MQSDVKISLDTAAALPTRITVIDNLDIDLCGVPVTVTEPVLVITEHDGMRWWIVDLFVCKKSVYPSGSPFIPADYVHRALRAAVEAELTHRFGRSSL